MASGIVAAVKRKQPTADIQLLEDDDEAEVTSFIPSGFANIDALLGGGWPVGRISENLGDEASGKSALADMAILGVQKMGGFAVVLEFENTRDKHRLAKMGIDLSRVVFHRPDYAEGAWPIIWQTLNGLRALVDKGKDKAPPCLIVWDSIGGSVPRSKVEASEKGNEEPPPMRFAKMMSAECPLLFQRIRNVPAHMMFINQVREVVGGMSFFKQTDSPGGRALKFSATVRLKSKSWMLPLKGSPKTGYCCKVTTIKNKIVPPQQSTTWVLNFQHGPSPALTALMHLIEMNVVKTGRAAGYYRVPWHSRDFVKDDWMPLMRDAEFARAAWDAVLHGSRTKPEIEE